MKEVGRYARAIKVQYVEPQYVCEIYENRIFDLNLSFSSCACKISGEENLFL